MRRVGVLAAILSVVPFCSAQCWRESQIDGIPLYRPKITFDESRGVIVVLGVDEPLYYTLEGVGQGWRWAEWGLPLYYGELIEIAYSPDQSLTYAFGDQATLWSWNGEVWDLVSFVPNGLVFSTEMAYTSVEYDTVRNRLLHFYTRNSGAWLTEYADDEWIQTEIDGHPIADRRHFATSFDRVRGEWLIFGGLEGNTSYQELWSWDGSDLVLRSSQGPEARSEAVFEWHTGLEACVLIGGRSQTGETLDDVWLWSGTDWVPYGNTPSPIQDNARMSGFDQLTERIVVPGWPYCRTLAVVSAPMFDLMPESQTLTAGEPLELVAELRDPDGSETFQWYRDHEALQDDGRIVGSTSSVLRVDDVGFADAGEYYVDASSGCETTQSDSAFVTVECPADFNGDGVVDTLDVLQFLSAWSNGSETADFNGDGQVNTVDFLDFLNAWVAGC